MTAVSVGHGLRHLDVHQIVTEPRQYTRLEVSQVRHTVRSDVIEWALMPSTTIDRRTPRPGGRGQNVPAEAARLLIIFWGSFPALRPLLDKGFPLTHDGLGHLLRLLDFDLAFRAGNLYPRL